MVSLKVKIGDVELDNPIIVSSGHVTCNGDQLLRADKFGPGAIVAKTALLEDEYDQLIKACEPVPERTAEGRFPDTRASFAATGDGFSIVCGLSPISIEQWAEWIKKHKKEMRAALIGSIAAITPEGYAKAAKILEEAGADALEINIGCPLPYLMRFKYCGALAGFNPEIATEIAKAVRNAVKLPVAIKGYAFPPDPSVLRIPYNEGFESISLTSAILGLPGIDVENVAPVVPSAIGVYGDRTNKHTVFLGMSLLADIQDKIHITAGAGTHTWEDIVELIMYGASSVQMHSIFMRKGFGVIPDLKRGLLDYMQRKNFETVEEMRGTILPKLLTYDEALAAFAPTKGKVVAQVDQEKCKAYAPCSDVCPLNIDVPGYVSLISSGMFAEALNLVRERNPLPSVCGRVCHRPCEPMCKRGEKDDPLSIAHLKRFVADYATASETETWLPPVAEMREEKVAIIGSGPAGLNAAYHLARRGYKVSVFESLPVAGGMLAAGIPEYRLPSKALQEDIKFITDLGVEIKTGCSIGKDFTINDLLEKGYKAVFIAVGAHKGKKLDIPGEDLEGVYDGISFLRDINLGKKVSIGDKVVVVGGGNVAIDVALSALRLKGKRKKEVQIVCLERREEMPANEEEIQWALEEGVNLRPGLGCSEILGKEGKVVGLETVAVKSVFDALGEFNPTFLPYKKLVIEADTIIAAIGQSVDVVDVSKDLNFWRSEGNTLVVDPVTLSTNQAGIFAGGDAVVGGENGSVVDAMASGERAAISIDKYLREEPMNDDAVYIERKRGDLPRVAEVPDEMMQQPISRIPVGDRVESFEEINFGYPEGMAVSEASRCQRCDCGICYDVCFYGAVEIVDNQVCISEDDCEGCGLCVANCPEGALSLKNADLLSKVARGQG